MLLTSRIKNSFSHTNNLSGTKSLIYTESDSAAETDCVFVVFVSFKKIHICAELKKKKPHAIAPV